MSAGSDARETTHWAVHEISLTPAATAALSTLAGSLGFDTVRIDLAACSDKWAIVRSLTHPYNEHSIGHHVMLTGRTPTPVAPAASTACRNWCASVPTSRFVATPR